MKTIKNTDLKDKIILMRADYNVPLENGKIVNDLRIRASLPTIKYLLDQGARQVIILSHLGRPEKKRDLGQTPEAEYSLKPVADHLKTLLGKDIKFGFYPLPDQKSTLGDEKVILLENLRYDSREEANSPEFADEIIAYTHPDLFVQDGFAVVHRAHASTDALAQKLPAAAGLLVEKEVKNLQKIIKNPAHPVLFIIGGSKVADKEPLIQEFLPKVDQITVGGKIAADGYTSTDPKVYVAEDFDENAEGQKLDIGPLSTAKIAELINKAKTIIWNGVLGYVEDPAYTTSSTIVAKLMGEKPNATTIILGGDTTGFVENLMKDNPDLNYSLVSTGGGAALEFLLNPDLPGLKALNQ